MATLQDTLAKRQTESTNQINSMYDKANVAANQSINNKYVSKLSEAEAQRDQIGSQYQASANRLGVNNEKQYRNANLGALMNGMGSGTQQQVQLANKQNFLNNYAALRGEEANAMNTANQNIANLNISRNNELQESQANNALKRSQALMENRDNLMKWYDNAVDNSMKMGNFAAGVGTYGQSAVNQMQNKWIAENPVVAYRMGMIDANTYKQLTGKEPNK